MHRVLLIVFATFVSFSGQAQPGFGAVEVRANNVVFRIDEQTEFLRMIFNLAIEDDIDEEYKPCRTAYYERIQSQFGGYEDHPMTQYVGRNEEIGPDFSTIGLMYKDWESFKFDDRYTEELNSYGISRAAIDSMKPLLKDLYQKTDFKNFFRENEDYYRRSVVRLAKQVVKERLFGKVRSFYQSDQDSLTLTVFVELTNNINNKAVSFYDRYNPRKRAVILANVCSLPDESTAANEVLELDRDIRRVLYHEISHLFTGQLLDKYVGDLVQYQSMCEGCNDIQIKDKVDHTIIEPLQALLLYRLNDDSEGDDFFLKECEDVRKDVYRRLKAYQPKDGEPFEQVYADCVDLIRKSKRGR